MVDMPSVLGIENRYLCEGSIFERSDMNGWGRSEHSLYKVGNTFQRDDVRPMADRTPLQFLVDLSFTWYLWTVAFRLRKFDLFICFRTVLKIWNNTTIDEFLFPNPKARVKESNNNNIFFVHSRFQLSKHGKHSLKKQTHIG